jgi:hypothetical protein
VVAELKTYGVSLVSRDSTRAADQFYKYHGEHLPRVGETIRVVRFVRGRVIRARVTYVDESGVPPIGATEIS